MGLLKKFLRGVYFFCVGVKAASRDFNRWYRSNRNIPKPLRNRAALAVMTLAIVAGGWGMFYAASHIDLQVGALQVSADSEKPKRTVPQVQSQAEQQAEPEEKPAAEKDSEAQRLASQIAENESKQQEQLAQDDGAGTQMSNLKLPSSASSDVDAIASATRYNEISDEELTDAINNNADQYYSAASSDGSGGTVYTPPAAGDIAAWKAINPDVRGWITISNTNINYPIVIGSYNDYYTHLGYYKEASRNGVIWFDSDTKFNSKGEITSQNAVLYGHNWTNCWRPVRIGNPNDVMFAQLAAYDDAQFAAQNPYVRIKTEGGDHLYQIFSVFYTTLDFAYNYADGDVVADIIKTAKSKSIHNFNVSVGSKDQIITLSTCTRILGQSLGENQRFVVMAKKIS